MADQRIRRHSTVGIVTRLKAGRSVAQIPAWTSDFPPLLEPYLHSLYTPLSVDTNDVTLSFMADHDYGLCAISEDKFHFFQITNDSAVTVIHCQHTLCLLTAIEKADMPYKTARFSCMR